ncbi:MULTISPECIES: heme-binding protein [unclassified Paenibacillus]|uniref:heme-binding protein n=1 Tax=unclassified Paenibacillus TaxID=185978 RepID=UPI000CF97471|nr:MULTISPECIES: heme-binding protein [unclassified Paenibacillus]MBJ9987855.1 heme-binding protein [Paenibacillus sp. S28]PQP85612.1 hypothetical protein CPT76_35250 [Paenibacillus sp. AR247]
MNIEQLEYLEHLEYLEKELILTDFTNDNALELGLIIINLAKAQKNPVAILIERDNVPIFTYLMENASIECIPMLYRKKRIVDQYNKSSAYISCFSPLEFKSLGGSFPLRIKNVGVVGSVSVASYSGIIDHNITVEGLQQFIRFYED